MRKQPKQKQHCYLCVNGIQDVDFKDAELLRKFLSSNMKIRPRRKSGLCARHQRQIARAVKQSRIAGFIPYIPK